MKKLLSVLAAGVLALGISGCSGDLHDVDLVDLSNYGIRGTVTGWGAADDIALEQDGDVYTVTVKSSLDDEGKDSFAVLQMGDESWATAFRLAQPKAQGDTTNSFTEDGEEQEVFCGQSANCMSVKIGQKTGDQIKITVTPGTVSIKVKVELLGGSSSDPQPTHLDGFFVRGNFNEWKAEGSTVLSNPTVDRKTGDLVYKYLFLASDAEHQFAIADNDWKTKYTGAEISLEDDFAESTKGADDNNKITGLTVGNWYFLKVKTTAEGKIYVKSIPAYKVIPTVTVTGLPEELNGTKLWFTGDFNDWKKPSEDGSIEATVENGSISVTLPEALLETEKSYSCKFANAGWTRPEIANVDGENATFTISNAKYTVKGAYKSTGDHPEGGKVYKAEWTVE